MMGKCMSSRTSGRSRYTNEKAAAINYILGLVKSCDEFTVKLDTLKNLFLEKPPTVFITVFEKLVFFEVGAIVSASAIDRALRSFKSSFPQPASCKSSHYNLGLFKQQKQNDAYSSSVFVGCFASELLTDFYNYIAKDGYQKENVLHNLKILHQKYVEEFDWLKGIQMRCERVVGSQSHISLQEFKKVIGLKSYLTERMFKVFDKNNRGYIELQNFYSGLLLLLTSDRREKIQFMFAVYDADGDGVLCREELEEGMRSGMEESSLTLAASSPFQLTNMIFDSMSKSNDSFITCDELCDIVLSQPSLADDVDISFQFLTNNLKLMNRSGDYSPLLPRVLTHVKVFTNLWIFMCVLIAVNLALLGERLSRRIEMMQNLTDIPLVIAKCGGQMLNFDMSFLLLLTLKHAITKLKQTKARHYLPLDDALLVHKYLAVGVTVISVIHIIAHIVLIIVKVLVDDADSTYFVDSGQAIQVFTSGCVLTVLLIIMLIPSMPAIRTKSYGNFYIIHVVVSTIWFIACIIHASQFWKWFLLPGILICCERLWFLVNIWMSQSIVESGTVLDKITHLSIKRPLNFKYNPGDYVVVNIPMVSKLEWHPFTISSSRHDEISLHIRSVGRWTGRLHRMVKDLQNANDQNFMNTAFKNYFKTSGLGDENQNESLPSSSSSRRKSFDLLNVKRRTSCYQINPEVVDLLNTVSLNWKVYLSGPFSSPSHDILNTEHAILVAGGIGVTPFVSVLESVIVLLNNRTKICPCGCGHRVWFDQGLKLKRIDFFWLTRDQSSLTWFIEIFKELEEEQSILGINPPLVNLHIYLTGLKQHADMRGTLLQLALDMAYEREAGTCMISGLQAKTKPGRPDWVKEFKLITESHKRGGVSAAVKPKVFACGPAPLCKELSTLCNSLHMAFKEEVFS